MSQFNVHEWNRKRRLASLNEAEVDAQGNLVDFSGGDWKSQVDEYDHIHFFIEPQMADMLEDKLIMAGIDMVDNYPYKGAHLLRVSLGSNAAADLVKAEKIVGQSAKKGSPEQLGESIGTRILDVLKKKLAQFKASVGSENVATNRQLESITNIIGLMGDLQADGILDQAYVDQQIQILAPKFQQIIDNASDSFIQGTDYERSTD